MKRRERGDGVAGGCEGAAGWAHVPDWGADGGSRKRSVLPIPCPGLSKPSCAAWLDRGQQSPDRLSLDRGGSRTDFEPAPPSLSPSNLTSSWRMRGPRLRPYDAKRG